MEHTSIAQWAAEIGSAAGTTAGQIRAIKKHLRNYSYPWPPDATANRRNGPYWQQLWRETRRARTADGRARVLGYDPDDPNTPGRIVARAAEINQYIDMARAAWVREDSYGVLWVVWPRGVVSDWELSREPLLAAALAPDVVDLLAARILIDRAVAGGLLPAAYDAIRRDNRGRYDGDAVHLDVRETGERWVLICVRRAEGSRYGVRTTKKTYYTIHTYRGELSVAPAPIPRVPRAPMERRLAYKSVAITADGDYASIYTGEVYSAGRTYREACKPSHGGGYYCYATAAEAEAAEVPDCSRLRDAPRQVVQVEVWGHQEQYDNGKLAYTYMRLVGGSHD